MPDLAQILDFLLHHPEQWAAAAVLFAFAAGTVKWTPPARTVVMSCSCGGGVETCRCGTPKAPIPRPFAGGAR